MTSLEIPFRRTLITAVIFLGSTTVALADRIEVPGDHPTIQEAINAASASDTIKVASGTYHGRLSIPGDLTGLRIVGKNSTFVDAHPGQAGNGSGIRIHAADVQLHNLTIRLASSYGIYSSATNTRLKGVTVEGCGNFGAYLAAAAAKLVDCVFRGNRFGVRFTGSDSVMEDCSVLGATDLGVEAVGTKATIRNCTFQSTGEYGAYLAGTQNRIEGCTFAAIQFAIFCAVSSSGRILDNKIRSCGSVGIYLFDCSGFRVEDNQVMGGWQSDVGIYLYHSDDLDVRDNQVQDVRRYGIYLENADNCRLVENTVRRCGSFGDDHGGIISDASSDSNSLVDNSVRDCTDSGIRILGGSNLIADNAVWSNVRDGLYIGGASNQVVGNRIEKNGAEGLENRGTDTEVRKNELKENRLDVTNAGTISVFARNRYRTGGTSTPPEVD